MNLAAGNIGKMVVEQRCKKTDKPRFGLASKSEQDEIMAGQQRIDQLRHDAILKSDDAGKEFFATLQPADEIRADLVLDPATSNPLFGEFAAAKAAQSIGKVRVRSFH